MVLHLPKSSLVSPAEREPSGLSRRRLMSVAGGAVAVGVLGGCAKPTWEEQQREAAKDPLIQMMMRDPMYAWNPATPATRTEYLSPKGKQGEFKPIPYARVSVSFTPVQGPEAREAIKAEIVAEVKRLGYRLDGGAWRHQLEGIEILAYPGADASLPDVRTVLETTGWA